MTYVHHKISKDFLEEIRSLNGVRRASQGKLTIQSTLDIKILEEKVQIIVDINWEDIPCFLIPNSTTDEIFNSAIFQIENLTSDLINALSQWELQFENLPAQPWRGQQKISIKERLRFGLTLNYPLTGSQILTKIESISQECEKRAKLLWKSVQDKIVVKQQSQLADYPSLFPQARAMKRRWVAWLGPTNSGKTYQAFEQLKKAKNGVYLAPLRLMALEGYEKLTEEGFKCHLSTGEERIETPGANLNSSTIEMVHLGKRIEIGIIDEAQMLSDPDRGWAWTQALIGLPAEQLLITGSPDVAPLLQILADMCGEELIIHTLSRKTPLHSCPNIRLHDIKKGDALVAFSRKDILAWREILGKQGKTVACIYGALGPEVRRHEAERFRNGEADVLIATDAIGMGLNLPIERVILTQGEKYDGRMSRDLNPSEVRQIGGRAGRFGFSKAGQVGMLEGSGKNQQWLDHKLHAPTYLTSKPYIQAPWSELNRIHQTMGLSTLKDLLIYAHSHLLDLSKTNPTDLERIIPFAQSLHRSGLALNVQHQYLGCPVGKEESDSFNQVIHWSQKHGKGERIPKPKIFAKQVQNIGDLKKAEEEAEILTAYLWLGLRWPEVYHMNEMVKQERKHLNELIEKGLRAQKLKKVCSICRSPLKTNHPHSKCERCWKKGR